MTTITNSRFGVVSFHNETDLMVGQLERQLLLINSSFEKRTIDLPLVSNGIYNYSR